MRCLAYRSEGLGPFNKEEEVANRSEGVRLGPVDESEGWGVNSANGVNGVNGVSGVNGVNGVDGVHARPCLRLG